MQLDSRPDIYPDHFVAKCKEEALTCSICTEPYEKPFCVNVCLHTFCKECIEGSLAARPTCPLCQRNFSAINLLADFDKEARVSRLWNKHMQGEEKANKIKQLAMAEPKVKTVHVSNSIDRNIFEAGQAVSTEGVSLNFIECLSQLSLQNSKIRHVSIKAKDGQATVHLRNSKIYCNITVLPESDLHHYVVLHVTGSGIIGGQVEFSGNVRGQTVISPEIAMGSPLQNNY